MVYIIKQHIPMVSMIRHDWTRQNEAMLASTRAISEMHIALAVVATLEHP
jgi:hypothetical protein